MSEPLAVREAPASYMLDAQRVRPGYKQTEVGVIPEDWEVVRFGEIASPRKQRIDPKKSGLQEFCVELEHIGSGTGSLVGSTSTSEQSSLKSVFRADDVLFGKLRAYLRKYWLANRAGVCSTEIWVLSPTDKLASSAYLFQIAQTDKFIEVASSSYGTHMPRSDWSVVRNYVLPIPSTKAEQEAIAGALSDADALIESLEQLIAKKRHLKQGAMQELLTGNKRLPGFSGEWEVKRLGEVATFYKGKGLPKSAIEADGKEPCIHYGELFTRYSETIREIISYTNTSDGTFRSVANDVLMPTSDVTPRGLAKASCVRTDGVVLGGDILVIRSDTNLIFGSFLSYLIRYEEKQVLQLVTGSTVFHLYGTDMKKFTFSMPHLSEQTAIATILSDMDTEIAALETRLAKTRSLKQGMMHNLLTGKIRLV